MSRLGGWEGYRVRKWRHEPRGKQRWLVIELEPARGAQRYCVGCGQAVVAIHDQTMRRIRELPVFDDPVELHVPRLRLACPACGPRLERLDWLDRHCRVTRRLADSVARLCAVTSVLHAARWHGIDWKTAKAIDFRSLERKLGPVDLDGVRRIAMDEFAVQKGHRYATVVVDVERKRVLWVGRGRSRAEIRPFFELLGPQRCADIQAVAMDMNTAYDLEVRQHCPNARVVYDLFHVIAKYGREVVSRVRVDAANQLRHDKPARKVVKRAHWLLLRNPANLAESEQVRLSEVLEANQSLMTVYVMKEQLNALWSAPTAWAWRRAWKQWLRHAQQSAIPALMHFAKCLRPYWRGILSRVRWPMHTGLLEGINNKIKVIKRIAYGYRDDAYFFLKIRAAFPGLG
ncbi:ISL3 family transposase [Pseudomonas aeruginosa]|nr:MULTISPECIES: ISL3 family transposase [Pseudomonadota]MBO1853096.1 ISL3 family transposase [Burkholderia cenocepacia]MCA7884879.1 ISL3 family transposase [Burkholderia contaminans]MCV6553981.1 ISL3 family transposase [Pseudomonas aeruginosa]RNF54935.1 ISL3 family transposase [Pseudomonas aeruginosa]